MPCNARWSDLRYIQSCTVAQSHVPLPVSLSHIRTQPPTSPLFLAPPPRLFRTTRPPPTPPSSCPWRACSRPWPATSSSTKHSLPGTPHYCSTVHHSVHCSTVGYTAVQLQYSQSHSMHTQNTLFTHLLYPHALFLFPITLPLPHLLFSTPESSPAAV